MVGILSFPNVQVFLLKVSRFLLLDDDIEFDLILLSVTLRDGKTANEFRTFGYFQEKYKSL
jgi:hypothetical protein